MRYPLAALALSFALPVFAGTIAADHVSVASPYVRQVPPGQTVTAAFLVLHNRDGHVHSVVKADSPVAAVAELHTHTLEGGMMRMRPVSRIDIAPRGETALAPGGYHIMFFGLKRPLKDNEAIPVTLTFEDGSRKKFDAPVRRSEGANGMGHTDHEGMKH